MKELRKGMWVRTADGIGILNNISVSPEHLWSVGEIHYTNSDGETILIQPNVALSGVAQAAFDDIPEPRRPTPERGAGLGYL